MSHNVLQFGEKHEEGVGFLLLHDMYRILLMQVFELIDDVVQATEGDHGA